MPIKTKKPDSLNIDWVSSCTAYKINIYENDWKLFVELDSSWKIKTNINWLINKVLEYEEKWNVCEIDHDLYFRINSWINIITWEIAQNTQDILEKLYYSKNSA